MISTRLTLISALASLILSSYATAEIYKTVDKNGRITYTDIPPANTNAKPVELKSLNTTPPPTAMPSGTGTTSENNNAQSDMDYQLHILAPANGTTLMPNERSISVSVGISSSLQNGDLLVYKLDGNTLEKSAQLAATINEPPRGEHNITVEVVSKDGKILGQTNAVTVLVMRPTIKQTATPVPKK
jgi:hypothetical protein